MNEILDKTGMKFGLLFVESFSRMEMDGERSCNRPIFNCVCECGERKEMHTKDLHKNGTMSCGCLSLKKSYHLRKPSKMKHGMSYTREYECWKSMKARCRPGSKCSKYYHKRGIGVCEEWNDSPDGLMRFVSHIGKAPSDNHTVDRIDTNKGYEPGNVRWATIQEQIINRRKYGTLESFTDQEISGEFVRRGLCLQT